MNWNPDALRDMVEKDLEIPPLPMVAQKALKAIDEPDADVLTVARIIEKDAGFSTQVLKIANSARYAGSGAVDEVPRAAARLGLAAVKNIVLMAANRSVYRKFGPVERELWLHSLAVAVAAEALAKRYAPTLAHEAFAAGMLHDVGKVIIVNAEPGRFAQTRNRARHEGIPSAVCERDEFGFDHCDVGSYATVQWTLPRNIQKSVLRHHSPDRLLEEEPELRRLCALVYLGDRIAHTLGLGERGQKPEGAERTEALEKLMNDPVVSVLALDLRQLEILTGEVERAFEPLVRDFG